MKQENILARFDSEIASYERMVDETTHASMTEKDWERVRALNHTVSALRLLRTQFACSLYPRSVYFVRGISIGMKDPFNESDERVIMDLPSDHFDFPGPIKVYGKTRMEIEAEVEKYL